MRRVNRMKSCSSFLDAINHETLTSWIKTYTRFYCLAPELLVTVNRATKSHVCYFQSANKRAWWAFVRALLLPWSHQTFKHLIHRLNVKVLMFGITNWLNSTAFYYVRCLTCFILIVRLFLTHWLWRRVTPFTWLIHRAYSGCERSTGDNYSCHTAN
jgi:hypothetical protein